jgi:hypothetical protein
MITLAPDDNIAFQVITFHPDDNIVIIWDAMLSSGAIMISSGMKCYNLG